MLASLPLHKIIVLIVAVTLNPKPTHDMLASNATFLAESLLEYYENKTGMFSSGTRDSTS